MLRGALVAFVLAAMATHAANPPGGVFGVDNESGLGAGVLVAPGSNVLVFSGDLAIGPPVPQTAATFPLVKSLAGTSVKVTVGGITLDAYVLGLETQWVRAMLPGNTPVGDGQLVVTYNGRSSVPYQLAVRERSFGIYDGSWCGPTSAPSRPSFCVNRVAMKRPARIPGALQVPGLLVLYGGRPAKVVYSGRSGCCAGMDEIIFEVPAGTEGCRVPVWVRYSGDGATAGDVDISVASGNGACSDPDGLSESEIRKLSDGNLRAAEVGVSANGYLCAAFGRASQTGMVPFGACGNLWREGLPACPDVDAVSNVGPVLNLHTPDASYTVHRHARTGRISTRQWPWRSRAS